MRAHLGTALSGPPPSLGSTVSVLSTMTATISPRLRKRRTMCSSTGPMFIPYPLPSQGPAWSPMLVSNLRKMFTFTLLHFCNTLLLTAHPHTIFKRCGTVDCGLGGMKMMKQPLHTPQGIVQDPMRRNVGFGNFQPERFLYYYAFN